MASTVIQQTLMPGARDRRVRVGSGGRPAFQGERRGGGGDVSIGTSISGGGSKSWGVSLQGNKGCLRYSPGEESAVKREMEKELRLRRLQQVREQSRKQAAAMRQEYRQRRDENKRAVLRESRVSKLSTVVTETFTSKIYGKIYYGRQDSL